LGKVNQLITSTFTVWPNVTGKYSNNKKKFRGMLKTLCEDDLVVLGNFGLLSDDLSS
jgi:hypothetical protein